MITRRALLAGSLLAAASHVCAQTNNIKPPKSEAVTIEEQSVYALAFADDGKTAAVAASDSVVLFTLDGKQKNTLPIENGTIGVVWGRGATVFAALTNGGVAVLEKSAGGWFHTHTLRTEPEESPLSRRRTLGLAVSPDGIRVYSAQENSTDITAYNLVEGTVFKKYSLAEKVNRFWLAPDGVTLYAYTEPQITAIATSTGKSSTLGITGEVGDIVFDREGKWLYLLIWIPHDGGWVVEWDIARGKISRRSPDRLCQRNRCQHPSKGWRAVR